MYYLYTECIAIICNCVERKRTSNKMSTRETANEPQNNRCRLLDFLFSVFTPLSLFPLVDFWLEVIYLSLYKYISILYYLFTLSLSLIHTEFRLLHPWCTGRVFDWLATSQQPTAAHVQACITNWLKLQRHCMKVDIPLGTDRETFKALSNSLCLKTYIYMYIHPKSSFYFFYFLFFVLQKTTPTITMIFDQCN